MNTHKHKEPELNKLDSKERFNAALKSLSCLVAAIVTLLYGIVFATNLSTLLNPVNAILNVFIAILCYGTVATVFIILWHHFNRYMTQAFSGLKN